MADDADLAAIRAFAAGGTNATVTPKQAERFQRIYGTAQTRAEYEQAQAEAQAAQAQAAGAQQGNQIAAQREADRQADRQQKQQRQALADQERAENEQRQRRKGFFGGINRGLSRFANNVPTPGGNLALVLILLFFAFAVIPVNSGRTRLQLIWDVLTGNAELPGSGTAGGVAGIDPAAAQAGAQAGIGAAISTATGGAFLPAAGLGLNYNLPGTSPAATATGAGPGQLNTSASDPLALLEAPRGNW